MTAPAVDALALARRLRSAAYNQGMDDQRDHASDGYYKAAAEKSDVAHTALVAEIVRLKAECMKSERRALMFADMLHSHGIAMQAAVIDGHLRGHAQGLQWIVNTLSGPGNLPDLEEARALGGAQAWWDRETAKLEQFRAEHPGP